MLCVMVRSVCRFPKCLCKDDLTEVTAAQEPLCKVLLEYHFGWDGFKRVPDSAKATSKTWLCKECWPKGLEFGDLLGERVAKVVGDQLFFGKVVEVCGISHTTRHLTSRVKGCGAVVP